MSVSVYLNLQDNQGNTLESLMMDLEVLPSKGDVVNTLSYAGSVTQVVHELDKRPFDDVDRQMVVITVVGGSTR